MKVGDVVIARRTVTVGETVLQNMFGIVAAMRIREETVSVLFDELGEWAKPIEVKRIDLELVQPRSELHTLRELLVRTMSAERGEASGGLVVLRLEDVVMFRKLVERSTWRRTAIPPIDQMRATNVDELMQRAPGPSGSMVFVERSHETFVFSADSTAPPDGESIIAPMSGQGRWLRVASRQ